MKKIFLSILLLLSGYLMQAQTTNAAPYCTEIFDLQYNSINTFTFGAAAPVNFGPAGSASTPNDYLFYNNVTLPSVAIGASVNVSLNFYVAPDAEPMYFGVYVDLDQSGTFDYPDELLMDNITSGSGSLPCVAGTNMTVNQSITIPATAVGGNTRMRIIRMSDILGATPTVFDPFNDFIIPCNTPGAWPNFIVGCAYDFEFNILVPTIVVNPTSLPAFSAVVGTPSPNQTYTISGTNLQSNVTITAPTHFEVSTSAVSGFSSSLSLTPVSGTILNTTIYVRYNPSVAGSHSGNIFNTSVGASDQFVFVSGTSTAPIIPTLTATPLTLTPFTAFVGYPSASQTYTLSGVYLSGNVNVSAPAEFEISTTASSGYGSSLVLTPVSGSLPATTIYVRYNPGSVGVHSGNVTNWSTGSNVINIPVNGTASAPPAPSMIIAPTTLSAFNTIVGIPSTTQTITVQGSYLTGNIDLNVPAPFEISTAAASGFGQTITLIPVLGMVTPITIYVRFNPTIPNTYNADLTISSLNITDVIIPLSGVGIPNTPIIFMGPLSLSYFITTFGIPSAPQTIQAGGNYLISPLAISAPQHFQVSTQQTTGYGSMIYLQPDIAGSVPSTTIYVRYNPFTPGNHQGYLTLTSNGAVTKSMQLNGFAYPTSTANISTENVLLYPTKTTDIVYVSENMKGASVELFDFAGKKIMHLDNLAERFSTQHLSNGLYLVHLIKDNKTYSAKLIKE